MEAQDDEASLTAYPVIGVATTEVEYEYHGKEPLLWYRIELGSEFESLSSYSKTQKSCMSADRDRNPDIICQILFDMLG